MFRWWVLFEHLLEFFVPVEKLRLYTLGLYGLVRYVLGLCRRWLVVGMPAFVAELAEPSNVSATPFLDFGSLLRRPCYLSCHTGRHIFSAVPFAVDGWSLVFLGLDGRPFYFLRWWEFPRPYWLSYIWLPCIRAPLRVFWAFLDIW